MHQLLCQSVRLHALAVHPVPCGLCSLQDPAAPRQDKMLQVHLDRACWLQIFRTRVTGNVERRSLHKAQRGRNLPQDYFSFLFTLGHSHECHVCPSPPRENEQELNGLGSRLKTLLVSHTEKEKPETLVSPPVSGLAKSKTGVFKIINYYLKWKCFRYAL